MYFQFLFFVYNKTPRYSGECKYHVVFATKYRRKAFYDARWLEIGKILRDLCAWKGVNIIEAEVCVDHVHMLLEIPPKMSVFGFMWYLKGKSSQMIYEKWANARFKYRNRNFWCRGYYVDTVGKNTRKIQVYRESTKRGPKFRTTGIRVRRSVYGKLSIPLIEGHPIR